jgi:ParB/RepB/Spo0J family partition protein
MSARETIPDEGQLLRADVELLFPSPTNPRKSFPEVELLELAESIKQLGVMQPILVRPLPAEIKARVAPLADRAELEIVAGERRWRASRLAGMTDVPILLRHLDDRTVICMQVVENLQREGLNAIDEAEGFGQLQEQGMSTQEVATSVGKSKAYIYAKVKLLDLCEEARTALREKKIKESVALLIARIPVPGLQRKALAGVIAPDYNGDPMSFRAAAGWIQRDFTHRLTRAPFDTTDEHLHPVSTSCTNCRDRLGNQPDTAPDLADVCTDSVCYQQKAAAHQAKQRAAAEAEGRPIISGADAKKIRSYFTSSCSEGYVALDERCYEIEDYPYYRQLYEQVPAEQVPVTMLDHPDDECLREIVVKADLSKALKAVGVNLIARSNTGAAERKKEEEKAEAENRYRRRLFNEIRSQPVLMLTTVDLLELAEFGLTRLYEEYRYLVAQTWYPECKKKEALERLHERLPNMTDTELMAVLRDIVLAQDVKSISWMGTSEPTRLLEAATRIGIDPERVRKDQEREDAGTTTVYRHPDSPETEWNGKGRKPMWVEAWESLGKSIDDLAVKITPAPKKKGKKQ